MGSGEINKNGFTWKEPTLHNVYFFRKGNFKLDLRKEMVNEEVLRDARPSGDGNTTTDMSP